MLFRRTAGIALMLAALPTLPARADDVSATVGKTAIEFKVGPTVAARYTIDPTAAKPFLWPVRAPNGVPVTRGWPMEEAPPKPVGTADHIHQKSVWFTHGDVIPEGIELKTKSSAKGVRGVDFWDENAGHGSIVCVKAEPVKGDPGAVVTHNEWKSPDGVKIMDEERTIRFRSLPAGRLFIFECKLTASVCPITFGDTKEGAFGVRVNDAMRVQLPTGGVVTAANGTAAKAPAKENLPMWGQESDWNDYSGTVDGKTAGITVFDDPRNSQRAAWHTRAYGLMAANPFGRAKSGFPARKGNTQLVRIEKGQTLTLRYGVYAHDGDAAAGKVAEAFEAFKK